MTLIKRTIREQRERLKKVNAKAKDITYKKFSKT